MLHFSVFAPVHCALQSTLELFLDLSVSYLDQDILAEAREGVFEPIKSDVMPLPHSAAHTIAHLLRAAPLPVLTHTVNKREQELGKHIAGIPLHHHVCKQSFYQVLQSTEMLCPDAYGLLLW